MLSFCKFSDNTDEEESVLSNGCKSNPGNLKAMQSELTKGS